LTTVKPESMLQIQRATKKDKNFRPHPSFNLKP